MSGSETLRSHFPKLRTPRAARSGCSRIDGRMRPEALAARLSASGPLAVRQSTPGFFGGRHLVWLDDASLLRLKLFWPRRDAWAAVVSVHFKSSVGWVVWASSTAGERVPLAAWSVRIDPEVRAFAGSSPGVVLARQ